MNCAARSIVSEGLDDTFGSAARDRGARLQRRRGVDATLALSFKKPLQPDGASTQHQTDAASEGGTYKLNEVESISVVPANANYSSSIQRL